MSMYRNVWECCGSVTETRAWEPTECPFCNDEKNIKAIIDAAEYLLDNRSNRHDHPETGETVEVVLADSLDDLAEAFKRLNGEQK